MTQHARKTQQLFGSVASGTVISVPDAAAMATSPSEAEQQAAQHAGVADAEWLQPDSAATATATATGSTSSSPPSRSAEHMTCGPMASAIHLCACCATFGKSGTRYPQVPLFGKKWHLTLTGATFAKSGTSHSQVPLSGQICPFAGMG